MRFMLLNRFFFRPQHAPDITIVSSERELCTAIESIRASVTPQTFFMNCVVVVLVAGRVKLGRGRQVKLTCRTGPVVMAFGMVHLEDLELVSGDSSDLCDDCGSYHDDNFPAVEVVHGTLLLRNVRIHGVQGSAVMNDRGSVSLDSCDIHSDEFFGVINKSVDFFADSLSMAAVAVAVPKPAEVDQGFFMSSRDCTFSGSLWHISAGADISVADEGALMAANHFCGSSCISLLGEPVSRHLSNYAGGRIQPWRPGCQNCCHSG